MWKDRMNTWKSKLKITKSLLYNDPKVNSRDPKVGHNVEKHWFLNSKLNTDEPLISCHSLVICRQCQGLSLL